MIEDYIKELEQKKEQPLLKIFKQYVNKFIQVNNCYPLEDFKFDNPVVAYCWFTFNKGSYVEDVIKKINLIDPVYKRHKSPKEVGFETKDFLRHVIMEENGLDEIIDIDPDEFTKPKEMIKSVSSNFWSEIQKFRV